MVFFFFCLYERYEKLLILRDTGIKAHSQDWLRVTKRELGNKCAFTDQEFLLFEKSKFLEVSQS